MRPKRDEAAQAHIAYVAHRAWWQEELMTACADLPELEGPICFPETFRWFIAQMKPGLWQSLRRSYMPFCPPARSNVSVAVVNTKPHKACYEHR